MYTNQSHTVSYCRKQDVFHISTLGDEIRANIKQCLTGQGNAYILLGIFNTYDEAKDYIKQLEEGYQKVKP